MKLNGVAGIVTGAASGLGRATAERLAAINMIGNDLARTVVEMLGFYGKSIAELTRKRPGGEKPAVLHDPCAIAYLIDPALFSGALHHVRVTREGARAGAMELLAPDMETGRSPVTVMTGLDAQGFYALLVDRLRLL